MERQTSPVILAGIGGSGSRVLARILHRSGRFMGTHRNESEDALDIAAFDYKWTPPFLASGASGLSAQQAAAMKEDFESACARHREGIGDERYPWGWKHTASIHLLPFFHEWFPRLGFVHLLRDGRDLAFGTTGVHTHVQRLGRAVLDGDGHPVSIAERGWRGHQQTAGGEQEATPSRKALFWARVNAACADYGESRMGERYLRIRFEDLCTEPEQTIRTLLNFAAPQPECIACTGLVSEVEQTASSGRWRDMPPEQVDAVVDILGPVLERFGYF